MRDTDEVPDTNINWRETFPRRSRPKSANRVKRKTDAAERRKQVAQERRERRDQAEEELEEEFAQEMVSLGRDDVFDDPEAATRIFERWCKGRLSAG